METARERHPAPWLLRSAFMLRAHTPCAYAAASPLLAQAHPSYLEIRHAAATPWRLALNLLSCLKRQARSWRISFDVRRSGKRRCPCVIAEVRNLPAQGWHSCAMQLCSACPATASPTDHTDIHRETWKWQENATPRRGFYAALSCSGLTPLCVCSRITSCSAGHPSSWRYAMRRPLRGAWR